MFNIFKKKNNETPADKQMLDWLSIESVTYSPNDGTEVLADITRDDIKAWLYAVTQTIQKSLGSNPLIKNWLSGTFYVADQEIEFYIMKKGGESPLKLLKAEKEKVKILEEKLRECTIGAEGKTLTNS